MATWNGNYTETEHDGYTEIDVSGSLSIDIEEGETFGNYLFDVTGSGDSCRVATTGWTSGELSSFTIHNLGWKGQIPSDASAPLMLACSGNARVEQIYLGDGMNQYPVSGGYNSHTGALRVAPVHGGHLTFDGLYLENWIDNAMYASPPGHDGAGGNQYGTLTIQNCYAVDSHIACYRVGTKSTIRNSYARASEPDHRAVWGWDNDRGNYTVTVEGCSFDSTPVSRAITASADARFELDDDSYYSGSGGAGVVVGGTQTSNVPEFVPDGCPTDAVSAASGDLDGGSGEFGRGTDYPDVPHFLRNVHVVDDSGDRVGVIARNGQTIVVDSEVEGSPAQSTADGGAIWSDNTNWGSSANPQLPESVPAGVSEASGGVKNGSDPDENR